MQTVRQLDPLDACGYAQALESLYEVVIITELRTAATGRGVMWAIIAKAYVLKDDELKILCQSNPNLYPSVNHKTFSGALLGSVLDLEKYLQAQAALEQLPLPGVV